MRQVAGEQRSRNPGATRTAAHAVNDVKQVVGIYYETAGLPHGFLYFRGSFTPVDFPGAIDTFLRERFEYAGFQAIKVLPMS